MKWFEVKTNLKPNDKQWILKIGDVITEPNWSIRPFRLNEEYLNKISYLNVPKPEYASIIMVPAKTVCKTHIDNKAAEAGLKQRITAINIPIKVHHTSMFQYMKNDEVIESIDLKTAKCWRVDIPHRVDNSLSPFNRVVLSLSYTQTVGELNEIYSSSQGISYS